MRKATANVRRNQQLRILPGHDPNMILILMLILSKGKKAPLGKEKIFSLFISTKDKGVVVSVVENQIK